MHIETKERLQTVTPEQSTKVGVVLHLLFAMRYYLFLGAHWTELINLSRSCLSPAFAGTPEISGMPMVKNVKNGEQDGARSLNDVLASDMCDDLHEDRRMDHSQSGSISPCHHLSVR